MKTFPLFVPLSLLLLALAWPAAAEPLPRLIHVNATGYVEAIPDQMQLSVTLKATRLSYEEAKQEVDAVTARVLAAARAAGVADDELDSSQLTAFRETRWDDKRRQQVYTGDAVQRQVSMKLTDPEAYPGLLKALSELDVQNIGRPVLQHSRLEDLQDAALRKALSNAERKARLMADQMGVGVGAVHSMSDQAGGGMPQPRMARAAMAMADMESAGNGSEAITFGKQKIYAAVSVSFEID